MMTPEDQAARKFRKKPVVVEAVQWTGFAEKIAEFCPSIRWRAKPSDHDDWSLEVWAVKEQCWVNVPMRHWLIRGVAGEFYPCAPDIFEATYEPAE